MENFDKIEKYLLNELSEGEKEDFEKEIAANEALAAEVTLHRTERRAMQLMRKQELRANLQQWNRENQNAQETPMRVSFLKSQMFRVAMAACFALAVGAWWFMQPSVPEKYFRKAEIAMRAPSSGSDPLSDVLAAMSDGQYGKALNLLEKSSSGSYSWDADKARGQCYFWLGEYGKAADVFSTMLKSPIGKNEGDEIEWYLLLVYWEKDDLQNAKILLDKILADPKHLFHTDAKALTMKFD